MMHHRTMPSRRPFSSRRSPDSHPTALTCRSSNVSRNLVLWGVCFALFQQHTPRVAASSASSPQYPSGTSAWKESSLHNPSFPSGGSASSDDGEDFGESDFQEDKVEAIVVLPSNNNDEASDNTAESQEENDEKEGMATQILINDENSKQRNDCGPSAVDPTDVEHEEESSVTDADSEAGEESDWEEKENDATAGMASAQSTQEHKNGEGLSFNEQTQKSVSQEQEAVVSDAEAKWFDSDIEADTVVKATVGNSAVRETGTFRHRPQVIEDEDKKETTQVQIQSINADDVCEADKTVTRGDQVNDVNEPQIPALSSVEVVDSEDESGEEEGSVALSEIESEEVTSDWSEEEETDDDSHGAEVTGAGELTEKPEISPPSRPKTTGGSSRATPRAAAAAIVPPRRKRPRTPRSARQYGFPKDMGPSMQPLKTLEKLQHMLDETDYMTAAPSSRGDTMRMESSASTTNKERIAFDQETTVEGNLEQKNVTPGISTTIPSVGMEAGAQSDKLWTSKDRMKYKKQQERIRRAKQEHRRLQEQLRSPPLHPNSSDGGESDDTDDGLGYTLPNLPVFFSDAEGATDLTDTDHSSSLHHSAQPQPPFQPPPPPFEQRGPYQYLPPPPGYYPNNVPPLHDQTMRQPMPQYYPPNPYVPYGYGPYNQQQLASQYAAAWASAAGLPPYSGGRPMPYRSAPPPASSSGLIEPRKHDNAQSASELSDIKKEVSKQKQEVQKEKELPSAVAAEQQYTSATAYQMSAPYQLAPLPNVGTSSSLAEASSNLSFDSVQKISLLAVGIALLCYSAVSPRTLPTVEYNEKFYENVRLVSLMMIAPALTFLMVFDPRENDINKEVGAFYLSFTIGYGLIFFLEIIFTTVIRLGVFSWFEPDVFQLTPQVPSLVLPWVLRENRYRPKRITLFAADFATTCVACPIIEEYLKLKILQWSARLPRNFKWTKKVSSKNKKKKRMRAEAVPRYPGDPEVTNINAYVSQMLAVSLGMKLCDSIRRILMYTKASDENKGFYALCRGIFPIQELCGTMTALALAKRDVLGWQMPLWKMLAPAVVIHGMANFRGMKPIFKWNSSTPWSEMQLLPWNAADDSTLPQLMNKGFAKLMWLVILGRVLGYCIKNYYLIRRQAVKRTTTYAGKRAAFSAELAATEMLKKTAKDK